MNSRQKIIYIVLIAVICIVILMSIFDLWSSLGIDKSFEKVIIVIAGFLGSIFARMIIKLLYEFIRWFAKTLLKLISDLIDSNPGKMDNKSMNNSNKKETH
ncbi:hypothetical protein [Marinifilum sp. D714]|uniref:hypothetical protein n=1 Tax=Marinifilum sp. D714 TaxID=2937523 RepID=UPI0027CB5101|nr:hypothetical protein [Marinifilum sp. D714]MDQ2178315.1 hypothetical protein [Marinifilum sp. D714]